MATTRVTLTRKSDGAKQSFITYSIVSFRDVPDSKAPHGRVYWRSGVECTSELVKETHDEIAKMLAEAERPDKAEPVIL